MLTGRPSDDRPTCPPPITAERARQNVPSASSYMSLKHSQSQRASGSSVDQDTVAGSSSGHRGSLSSQSVSQSQHQRGYDDEARTPAAQKKKVRTYFHKFFAWWDTYPALFVVCHIETWLSPTFTTRYSTLTKRNELVLQNTILAALTGKSGMVGEFGWWSEKILYIIRVCSDVALLLHFSVRVRLFPVQVSPCWGAAD